MYMYVCMYVHTYTVYTARVCIHCTAVYTVLVLVLVRAHTYIHACILCTVEQRYMY